MNIPNYPELEDVHKTVKAQPSAYLVNDGELAKEAGSSKAGNMVIVGAASRHLPFGMEDLKKAVSRLFPVRATNCTGKLQSTGVGSQVS